MNRLIQLLASCEFGDVASLRRIYTYEGGETYEYEGVTIECGETQRTTPEFVKFTLGFPLDMLEIAIFGDSQLNTMIADYGLREFGKHIDEIYLEKGLGKEKYTGKISIHKPTSKIVLRSSSFIRNKILYISLTIRFPVLHASKRNAVAGKACVRIVQKDLARAIRNFLYSFDPDDFEECAAVYKRQQEIRHMLSRKGLVGFIANGSILPRNGDGFALKGAVPFQSPYEDEIEMQFPDGFVLHGMGIKEGVTVITGGGYSGKSTLLDGLMHGIYDHVPGDGREYCIMQERACKIIAEDGRSVTSLDISPFIRNKGSLSTKSFTSQHASGSTSQAANIMEAISFGCSALLIDEDRTATNFMIRDTRMKKIIKDDPIVPFTDRVRQIHTETGISTILIIGGSSEYLDLADNVYMMKDYLIANYNNEVAKTRQNTLDFFTANDKEPVKWRDERTLVKKSMSAFRKDETNKIREFVSVNDDELYIGIHRTNIARLETIISSQQGSAIAFVIRYLFTVQKADKCHLLDEISNIYEKIKLSGFDDIYSSKFGIDFNLELPTIHDILFALSRMNNLKYENTFTQDD
ncbi:MAG: ABC-ATPase domain-containing protein [Defluviitaleaceae bacterium]|nr:ABC-ATPase domain-containing protein [Defluviitaleaceae bacterium]MCL2274497.1 ABC-ATPase domain-containing protein [Defluviitaleaceae bacterium]